MKRTFAGAAGTLLLFFAAAVQAQSGYGLHEQHRERIDKAGKITAVTYDSAFGAQIAITNGLTEFAATDISIPGNSGVPVELRRRLVVDDRSRGSGTHIGGFGEWDIDLPNISVVAQKTTGWTWGATSVNQRCSSPGSLPDYNMFPAETYGSAYTLRIPGGGGGDLLINPSAKLPAPTNGVAYRWVTRDFFRVSCASTTLNRPSPSGESFVAWSPGGLRYHLKYAIAKPHASIYHRPMGHDFIMLREVQHFLVTRVEDRFGQGVDYTYENQKLKSIVADDGRYITLTYDGDLIVTAQSSAGTWSYQYLSGRLSAVVLPDSSKWQYATEGGLAISPPPVTTPYEDLSTCPVDPNVGTGLFNFTVTNPSGAIGKFHFDVMQHGRANPSLCFPHDGTNFYRPVPNMSEHWTLLQRDVSGPGVTPVSWSYAYLGGVTEVTGPDGFERTTFGLQWEVDDSQILKVERGASSNSISRTTTNLYVTNAQAGTAIFPDYVGTAPHPWSNRFLSAALRPLKKVLVNQDGVNFTQEVDQFNSLAAATAVRKFSSIAGVPVRSESTVFRHDLQQWVLGQVETSTVNGVEASRTDYNAASLPWKQWSFGKLKQTMTYNASGQPVTVADARNAAGFDTMIHLSNWYRGLPRTIQFPATWEHPATTQLIGVHAAGWVTSTQDENGFVTGYAHDAMGRLKTTTWPQETAADPIYPASGGQPAITQWTQAEQRFERSPMAVYGLPADHWVQTVWTGNGYARRRFDALWRPVVEERYDSADIANTRSIVVKRYDTAGRLAFESYPVRTLGTVSDNLLGTWTLYDALDRPVELQQDQGYGLARLRTTTQYLTGFRTRVTKPKHQGTAHVTETDFLAWDTPTFDYPTRITHPEGAVTEIERNDPLAKPTALTRRNVLGTLSVTRRYTYDVHQQLCKTVEPETGATMMGYDAAGNLAWSAPGQVDAPGCGTVSDAARVSYRTYDTRGRLKTLRFSDTRGDQDWSYTPDGLPLSVTTVNVPGAVHPINQYKYNRRRMLIGETQHLPAWYSYSIAYSFDVGGHLRRLHYPSSDYVDFAPNALGQATRATNSDGLHYARDAVYYPNGALQQFTYGNDIVHTMEQNARQLPERVRSMYGSATRLDFTYAYDANSNITSILDGVPRPGSNGHRTMGYDALDRLTHVESATFASAYGGANRMDFGYDALDNLKTWKVSSPGTTARDDLYCYNGTNRLAQVRNGATSCSNGTLGTNLSYDPNGNVQVKNTQAFDFDYGNRLREVIDVERYRYDAHGRRILAMNFQLGTVTSQYANSGQLLFQKNPRAGVSKDIDHVYFGGSLIAQREQPIGGGVVTVKYQHTDALGSPVVVTSQTRAVLERVDYEPYGKQLGSAVSTGNDRPGYTGHVEDRATGLTYMQQRYYDPQIGVFLSVDPVTAYGNPVGAFNRYWYANSNPYKFTDPDGRAVVLGGNQADQQTLIQQAEQFTGMKVSVDSSGNMTTGMCGIDGAARALTDAIDSSATISLTAVSNDPGVFIDQYVTGKVDVADIGGFAAQSTDLGAAAFTHVLTEYKSAMESGGNSMANFTAAHAAGLTAESAVMGAMTRTESGSLAPGASLGINYLDASGNAVKSFNFTIDPNGTPR